MQTFEYQIFSLGFLLSDAHSSFLEKPCFIFSIFLVFNFRKQNVSFHRSSVRRLQRAQLERQSVRLVLIKIKALLVEDIPE